MPRYYRQSCQFIEKLISSRKMADRYIYHVFEVLKGHFQEEEQSRITMESNNQRQQTYRNDFYYFITDRQIKKTVFQMARAP